MDIKKTTDDVVEHVKKHKEAYIIGALGVLGIVVTVVIMRNYGASQAITVGDNSAVTFGPKSTINYTLVSPGNSGNVIRDTTTGAIYPSQSVAADALGVSKGNVSNHLRGIIPDLKGHVLEKIVDGVVEYELVRN